MKKKIKSGVILVCLFFSMLWTLTPVSADTGLTWMVADPNFVTDSDGITKLAYPAYVQLWDVDRHELVDEAEIGFFMAEGEFYSTVTGIATGATYHFQVRAFNVPKDLAEAGGPGVCSGVSEVLTLDVGEPPMPETLSFAGFSTDHCPGSPTAITFAGAAASRSAVVPSSLLAGFVVLLLFSAAMVVSTHRWRRTV